MSEANIEAYFSKTNEIITACQNLNTTKQQLETLLNELEVIDAQLETDFNDPLISVPTTLLGIKNLVDVEIERENKITLHYNLKQFYELKRMELLNSQETNIDISEEKVLLLQEMKSFIDTYIENCSCMSKREFLMKYQL